jgi:hypothetical protein
VKDASTVPGPQRDNAVLVPLSADRERYALDLAVTGRLQRARLAILVRLQGHERRTHASDNQLARVPGVADAFDFFDESWAVDFERSRSFCAARVVVVGYVEGVSQKADVCSLQCVESLAIGD